MRKSFLFFTFSFLLATFLCGCATTPVVSVPRFKETVTIAGTRYISADALSRIYNLDYHWDPITKTLTLSKDNKEVRMMVDSSTVLLNNTVRTMDKETKLYRGMAAIPESFVRRRLSPFFGERYIKRRIVTKALGLPIKNVIIDPGHGGKDPGAIGRGGLREKDVVLDIAKKLKRELNATGINVILTRPADTFVSLSQRARIANTKEADFFVSIHANASRSRWIKGIEVFYLSESIDDSLRSLQAARNYNLNLKERYSGEDTATILWDLIYTENRRESIQLASLISRSLSKNLYQRNRGIKPGRFYVLKGTNIPAILVEVGFISNSLEEKKLRNVSYRDKIAQGVAEGIIQYNRSLTRRHTARY